MVWYEREIYWFQNDFHIYINDVLKKWKMIRIIKINK